MKVEQISPLLFQSNNFIPTSSCIFQVVCVVEATKAGLDFFRVFPAYTKVTIRIMSDSGIAFVADMSRDAAKTAEAALAGGDTVESQSQVMLAQVWTPKDNSNPAPETAKN